MSDERARAIARALLAAACADLRPGVPLAQRLEDAAPAVLGPAIGERPNPRCEELVREINAAPPRLREYVFALETGMAQTAEEVRDRIFAQDTARALAERVRELESHRR